MRHGKTHNHLGRKVGHRRALLRNLAISLITHKRISTTLAKAKALRVFVEPILTTSKANSQHAHREAFRMLQNKEAVKELFAVVSPAILERPGGYVRVIRTGTRLGDNAETALIELVDFNETYNAVEKKAGSTRRRRRRAAGTTETTSASKASASTTAADQTESDEVGDDIASAIVAESAESNDSIGFVNELDAVVGEPGAVVTAPEVIEDSEADWSEESDPTKEA